MHLIKSTEEFKIFGLAKPNFPILLREDMSSCLEANEFLRSYLSRGAIGSSKSWWPTGQAMYDYLSFLEAHDLAWNDVDRGERKNLVAAYRDYSLHQCGNARSTVRPRVHYIAAFYEFAVRRKWIAKLPFEYEQRYRRSSSAYLAHLGSASLRRSVADVMPRAAEPELRFLTIGQAELLLSAANNPHHRIIIRLALQSGLRREELATFPLAYVVDPARIPVEERNVRIFLDPEDGSGMKTKGSRPRTIYISRAMMAELHHYAIHRRGERASRCDEAQRQLFLTKLGQPWSEDGRGLSSMVKSVGQEVGLRVHPHMLRHTYATHTLMALQRFRGDNRIEPLVFLQKQLGHASIEQTMRYLHLVNELAENAVLAYDDELNRFCGGFD